jgi:ribosomal protein S27AE
MKKRIRFGRQTCPQCGDKVTRNALGFAAHKRGDTCGRRQFLNRNPGLSRSLDCLALWARLAIGPAVRRRDFRAMQESRGAYAQVSIVPGAESA